MSISIRDIEKGDIWKNKNLAFYYRDQKYARSNKRVRCKNCGGHYLEKYLDNGLCVQCREG